MTRGLRSNGLGSSGLESSDLGSDRQRNTTASETMPFVETPPPDARFREPEDPYQGSRTGSGEAGDLSELDLLQMQNADLRERANQLETLLVEATRAAESAAEQQKDLEKLLDEKSDIIRELHVKLQEQPARPPAATPREEELLALSEELEQERNQLKEDEEALTLQMREMELQMSRERAELARQRNELQRLHSEIKHELETASREAELRDRLQPLQRRQQELLHRRGGEPPRTAQPQDAATPATPTESSAASSQKSRRFFGWLGR
jgi:hypothetical protein